MKSLSERVHTALGVGLTLASLPLLAPSAVRAENPLPEGAEALINGTVEKSTPLLAAAVDLANRDAKSDKNFVVFLKVLRDYGFGAPVARPPWADEPDHEDPDEPKKELSEEEKKEAAKKHEEMVEASRARAGRFELTNFKRLDLNGDTKTDAEEIATALRDFLIFQLNDRFINIDGNKDGKLSLREYALTMPARGKIGEDGVDWHQREHFEEDDTNGSGFIEMEEVLSGYIENIHRRALRCLFMFQLEGHDKNGDGKLDREEFTAISEEAGAVYEKIFEEGEALEISNAYARLFWVPSAALEKLMKSEK